MIAELMRRIGLLNVLHCWGKEAPKRRFNLLKNSTRDNFD